MTMPAYTSLMGTSQSRPSQAIRDRGTPSSFRVLDWTNLDTAPSSMDVTRMVGNGTTDGTARLAILVNTPRMLRAADVFAEQAGLHGAQVRVFVSAKEALAWLYKELPPDLPPEILGNLWPSNDAA